MHNLGDDNELDKLSRDAAWRYDNPGTPDWQKMSAELDKVLPVERKRRTGLLLWLVPGLLLMGGGGYWLMSGEKSSPGTEAAVVNNNVAKPSPAVPPSGADDPAQHAQIKEEPAATSIHPPDKQETTENISNNFTLHQSKTNGITGQATPGKKADAANERAAEVSAARTQQQAGVEKQDTRNKPYSQDKNGGNNINAAAVHTAATTNTTVENAKAPVAANTINNTQPAEVNKPAVEEPETHQSNFGKTKEYKPFGKGFSLALIAGVDKSTVKFTYGNDPGYNLGLLAGYYFGKHLSFHAGAVFTQKNYKMAGEDFTAPKGTIGYYYKLENVEGYCRMWDVPIMLRYTFNIHGRNDFYLAGGLSSYFMTIENYNYFYHYQGNPVTRNANYASDDQHILSILHLSGGFETRVADNMTLQLEPYAKLPLSGVGLGSIRLSSFGINVGLQLRQPAKK